MQRTDWAEIFLEQFSRIPLTWENVFRSMKYLDKTEKEVADFILVLRNEGIFISLKCQRDPAQRQGVTLAKWVNKKTKDALKQLQGGIKTSHTRQYWCEHARRGRVVFRPKQIRFVQAIVLVETLEIVRLSDELAHEIGGIPVSYFSVNDFLNIVNELRTIRDIQKYLERRRFLPQEALTSVGIEKTIYEYYILNNGIFPYVDDLSQLVRIVNNNRKEISELIRVKSSIDEHSHIIEKISDTLSKRLEGHEKGLDEITSAKYDSPSNRKTYIKMQNELCDLVLDERRKIGEHFWDVTNKVKSHVCNNTMGYKVIRLDSKPDFLYVLSASKGCKREELIKKSEVLIRAALAEYDKKRGMAIVHNHDIDNFEVILIEKFEKKAFDTKIGNQLLRPLKIEHIPLLPL